MKKLTILLLAALCAAGVSAQAQDNCFFPTRKGAELSYKYYNARGRELRNQWRDKRWMKLVVEDVWPSEDGMVINVGVGNDLIDRMAKTHMLGQAAGDLAYGDVKIEGNRVTYDNIQWLANVLPEHFLYIFAHDNKDSQQYRLELMAQNTFPRQMAVGDTLPDEDVLDAKYIELLTPEQQAKRDETMKEIQNEIEVLKHSSGISIVGSFGDFSITAKGRTINRRVEALEKVETPAGVFDCYKITYELIMPDNLSGMYITVMHGGGNMMMNDGPRRQEPEGVRYADWISPEVGLVKREKYNDRGKLQEMVQLESYTK